MGTPIHIEGVGVFNPGDYLGGPHVRDGSNPKA